MSAGGKLCAGDAGTGKKHGQKDAADLSVGRRILFQGKSLLFLLTNRHFFR
jgi:hypothetical protein